MTQPLAQALIAHADSVFVGPNVDYAAVREALASVTAAQAARRQLDLAAVLRVVEHLIGSKQ